METTLPAPGPAGTTRGHRDQRSFLLQRAQPAMAGLTDGSLSTLAPVFAVALATRQPHYALLAGLATAIGAGVSMAFSRRALRHRRPDRPRPPRVCLVLNRAASAPERSFAPYMDLYGMVRIPWRYKDGV